MDLAIGITVGASIQVALLVAPILVFAGLFLGQDMNLLFTRYEMWAVVLAVFITRDADLRRRVDLARGADADRDLLHAGHRLLSPPGRRWPTRFEFHFEGFMMALFDLSLRPPPGDGRRGRATRRRARRHSHARARRAGVGGLRAGGGADAADSAGRRRHLATSGRSAR